MDLIRLRDKQHRKPTVANRLEAKAQCQGDHRGNDGCIVPMPIAAHQERRWARMMQLIRPTDQATKERIALGQIGIFPPVENSRNEIRS